MPEMLIKVLKINLILTFLISNKIHYITHSLFTQVLRISSNVELIEKQYNVIKRMLQSECHQFEIDGLI